MVWLSVDAVRRVIVDVGGIVHKRLVIDIGSKEADAQERAAHPTAVGYVTRADELLRDREFLFATERVGRGMSTECS